MGVVVIMLWMTWAFVVGCTLTSGHDSASDIAILRSNLPMPYFTSSIAIVPEGQHKVPVGPGNTTFLPYLW